MAEGAGREREGKMVGRERGEGNESELRDGGALPWGFGVFLSYLTILLHLPLLFRCSFVALSLLFRCSTLLFRCYFVSCRACALSAVHFSCPSRSVFVPVPVPCVDVCVYLDVYRHVAGGGRAVVHHVPRHVQPVRCRVPFHPSHARMSPNMPMSPRWRILTLPPRCRTHLTLPPRCRTHLTLPPRCRAHPGAGDASAYFT